MNFARATAVWADAFRERFAWVGAIVVVLAALVCLDLDAASAHGAQRPIPQDLPLPESGLPAPTTRIETGAVDESNSQERREAAARARAAAEAAERAEQRLLEEYSERLALAEARLHDAPARRAERDEAVLGLLQQAVEARADPRVANRVYDELRSELRSTRTQLSRAIRALGGANAFPPPPTPRPDSLSSPAARDRDRALRLRHDRLLRQTLNAHRQDARLLIDRLTALNEARLGLLPFLTDDKRRSVTGFSMSAWDQVSAELGHLGLIIRYHAVGRADAVRTGSSRQTLVSLSVGLLSVAIAWSIAIAVFLVWRSNTPRLLLLAEQNIRDGNLAALKAGPDFRLLAVRLISSIRSPIEWILLLLALRWLLPEDVRSFPELLIVAYVVGAVLIAALVARLLDFAFGGGSASWARKGRELASLRLGSMRLVANTTVALGLVLTVTSTLVGKGAVYHWVGAIGWLVAALVAASLVYRWRHVTLDRVERRRRPGPLSRWVIAHRSGRLSPVALLLGTVIVVGRLLAQKAKAVGSRFASVRRGFAFLFRQELSRTDRRATSDLVDLSPSAFNALSPDVPGDAWIATSLQGVLDEFVANAVPGLVAFVGERGSGKSTALDYLHRRIESSRRLDAVSLLDGRDPTDGSDDVSPVLVDNFDALIRFDVGGLSDFDRILDCARQTAHRRLWVLALDSAVWPLICRLREPSAIFSSVIHIPRWPDAAIAELLTSRSAQAGVVPRYERLIDHVSELDDIDRLEAIEAKSTAFTLLLWDASHGNPGIALHLWRSILGADAEGEVFVRPFHTPSEAAIERLPLEALFVYRAVLRQPGAPLLDVVASTRLSKATVVDVLRNAVSRGHIESIGEGYRLSWDWFRAVTRGLGRRHLGHES